MAEDPADRSPLASPSIGTSRSDHIQPCEVELRATRPSPPKERTAVALSFSGGGFRATLASLGVLRFVADAGMLDQVRYVSSVSGGSVANALFGHKYEEVERGGFTPQALDEIVITPFVTRITTSSLSRTLIRNVWRTIGPKTRIQVTQDLSLEGKPNAGYHTRGVDDESAAAREIFELSPAEEPRVEGIGEKLEEGTQVQALVVRHGKKPISLDSEAVRNGVDARIVKVVGVSASIHAFGSACSIVLSDRVALPQRVGGSDFGDWGGLWHYRS